MRRGDTLRLTGDLTYAIGWDSPDGSDDSARKASAWAALLITHREVVVVVDPPNAARRVRVLRPGGHMIWVHESWMEVV